MLVLSKKEQLKLDIVSKVYSGQMTRSTAMDLLEVSDRTIRRYLKSYELKNATFVKHGNHYKTPHNKINPMLKKQVIKLIKKKYFDLNILHLQEKLKEEGLNIKRETLRKWCHEIGHKKRKHRRTSRARYLRPRSEQEGLLIQFDGSTHKWFNNTKTCLIVGIDDATGNILYGEFFESESLVGSLKVIMEIIKRKGVFKVLYTDRAGMYGNTKRKGFSQVQRALGELDSHVLFAHSPQAKGRVERLFKTLQDRLISELRLKKVKTIKQANEFFNDVFVPAKFNPKFGVEARSKKKAYEKIPRGIKLEEVFCIKDYRNISNDHTINWKSSKYIIANRLRFSLARNRLEIRTYLDGSWKAYFAGKELILKEVDKITGVAA